MKTVAFAGSNSSTSINHQLVSYVAEISENTEVVKLTDFSAPMYSEDLEKESGIPKSIKDLDEKLAQADKLIISVGEHNGNISAFFKNILDWLSRNNRGFLTDKKVMLLSTSPGESGAKSALAITKTSLPFFGATVVNTFSLSSFYDNFKDGKIADPKINEELIELIGKFEK